MKPERTPAILFLFFIFFLALLYGCAGVEKKPSAAPSQLPEQQAGNFSTATILEKVVLERMQGNERVSIRISGESDFNVSKESGNILLIRMKGVSIPLGMEREYRQDSFRNLGKVVLYDEIVEGEKEARARLVLGRMVPYRYRKDGMQIVIDFDVSVLKAGGVPDAGFVSPPPPVISIDNEHFEEKEGSTEDTKKSHYIGEELSLDFQDADINSVFRLISEVSGFSIVAGPGVKSEVTIHMKKIPWDQALDAVLEINGLGKKQSGRVITVLPLEALKKAEEEQKEKDVAQGRLRQISIEAKIVEVTTNFAQEMGIKWGAGLASGNFATGIGNSASGTVTPIPSSGIGLTNSSVAVNFPSAAANAVNAPAIGLLYGTSKMILDAKLSALETTGDGKIISSPKVTTLDSVTATIKQGEEIPYTVVDSDGKETTEFKEAVLKLEVTPTITQDDRISIKVSASNDYADWEIDEATGLRVEKPPINTSSVDSTVVVRDGETIVIGGVYKMTSNDTMSGVPWVSNIPGLGWLFKYKSKSNEKRELLIFVTPKMVGEG